MGRRRAFDIDAALDAATKLFWRKGYDGASLDDLTQAMGISPPSLYLAFGSKEALFRRIVARYQAEVAELVEAAFGQTDTRALVETLLDGMIERVTDPRGAPGCLVLNSSLPIDEDHGFRREWAEQRQALRRRLQERFADARRQGGDLPPDCDSAALAQMVSSLVWGFAVEAQSGAPRAALRATAAQFLKLWPALQGDA
jgi:AcrR family transcriptional regulator